MTPSAWRDGGRGETIRWATAEDRSRHDAGRGDRQGHLPALVRRGRDGAAAALPQGDDRPWRRRHGRSGPAHGGRGERARKAARSAARRPRHRLPGSGLARAEPHSGRARRAPMPRSRLRSAARRRCARRARPTAPTMSPCSSPATASSAPTARRAAMPTGSSARRGCSRASGSAERPRVPTHYPQRS